MLYFPNIAANPGIRLVCEIWRANILPIIFNLLVTVKFLSSVFSSKL